MAVPIIENWSDIVGEIRNVQPSPETTGFLSAEILLQEIRPVPEFANLLDGRVGQSISVKVPQELGQRLGLRPGATFRGRVRQSGVNSYFVHPEHATLIHKN